MAVEDRKRLKFDATRCRACEVGRLATAEIWEGTATCWYCVECGHVNRWLRKPEGDQNGVTEEG